MRLSGIILAILFVVSGVIYYLLVCSTNIDFIEGNVLRVIDGDTLELFDGERVRLKGINTPEMGQFYSEEANEFLKEFEGCDVQIESYGLDKYGRILGYMLFEGRNLNREILKNGLATAYFYEEDRYFDSMISAEEFARENEIGLWKRSSNFGCLEIEEFDYISDGGEVLVFNNFCGELEVTFKDDATHIYPETLVPGLNRFEFEEIWNDDGDSIYVWDSEGLILFFRY